MGQRFKATPIKVMDYLNGDRVWIDGLINLTFKFMYIKSIIGTIWKFYTNEIEEKLSCLCDLYYLHNNMKVNIFILWVIINLFWRFCLLPVSRFRIELKCEPCAAHTPFMTANGLEITSENFNQIRNAV